MGTQFNVKAYEEDDWIEVSYREGKVEVQREDKKRKINSSCLLANKAYYDNYNHSLTTRTVDIAHYTSWRNGIYYLGALPLKEIVKTAQTYFQCKYLHNLF
ncbi:MAG: hypothetical protein V8Q76_01725 [Bacteroides intestinalis]